MSGGQLHGLLDLTGQEIQTSSTLMQAWQCNLIIVAVRRFENSAATV